MLFVRPGSDSTLFFRRLVGPMIGLLSAAVLANVLMAAGLAARKITAQAAAVETQVTTALAASRVPLTPPVLAAVHRLTRCHFVTRDLQAASGVWTTFPPQSGQPPWRSVLDGQVSPPEVVAIPPNRYRVSLLPGGGVRPERTMLLVPLPSVTGATFEAVTPVLVVAGITLTTLIPLGFVVTGRLTRRISAIEGLVGRIAAGDFGCQLPGEPGHGRAADRDEIDRLRRGVNQMSDTLASLRDSLVAGERQRLLGQLAAGFAHELRNAITGARLAIDLHRRRCPLPPPTTADDSLVVATRQLDILEEEVRGLLALGRPDERPPVSQIELAELLAEVHDLVGPRLVHAGTTLTCDCPSLALAARAAPLRAAIVNLVLNAIDAAGSGGCVTVTGERHGNTVVIAVEDTGPGVPPTVADSITDPFVTAKPEGVGLGLAVARAVAEERGGTLSWRYRDGLTRFELRFPAGAAARPEVRPLKEAPS